MLGLKYVLGIINNKGYSYKEEKKVIEFPEH